MAEEVVKSLISTIPVWHLHLGFLHITLGRYVARACESLVGFAGPSAKTSINQLVVSLETETLRILCRDLLPSVPVLTDVELLDSVSATNLEG